MISVDATQLEALRVEAQRRFEGRLAAVVRANAPRAADRDAARGAALAARAIAALQARGVALRAPAWVWARAAARLGVDFDRDPLLVHLLPAFDPAAHPVPFAQALNAALDEHLAIVEGPLGAARRAAFARVAIAHCPDTGDAARDLDQSLASCWPELRAASTWDAVSGLASAMAVQAAERGLVEPRSAWVAGMIGAFFGVGCFDDPLHGWIAASVTGADSEATAAGRLKAGLERAARIESAQ